MRVDRNMCPACTGDPFASLCRSSSGMDENELSWLASLQIAGSFSSDSALPPIQQQDAVACQSSFQCVTASRPPQAPVVRMPSTLLSDLAAEMLSSPTPTNPESLTGFPSLRRPGAPVPSAECASELPSLQLLDDESGPLSTFGAHHLIAAELNDVEGDADEIPPPAANSSFSNGELLSPNSFSDFAILQQPRYALTCRRSDAGILSAGRLMTGTSAAPEPHSGVQRRASESAAGSYRINPSTAFDTSLSDFSFSSSPPMFPPWRDTDTILVAPASAAKTRKSPMKKKSQIQGDTCYVQSCRADLRDSKPYNRRYNMCPGCMKAGSVVVDDNEMRWCQQCSCLHPLSEFLGKRRSCTEKMDKHKDRRRARNKERREMAKQGRSASQN